MAISQPSWDVTAEDLVLHIGDYVDDSVDARGRIMLWNGTDNYLPAAFRTDTTVPREFRGPTDPSTIVSITLADYDTWIPIELDA